MISQAHIYVVGDVIGVGFRAWTKVQAQLHQVTGWVRNTHNREDICGPNGGVEIVAQAEEDELISYIELLRQGSPISHIDDLEIYPEPATEKYDSFEVRPSV